MEKPDAGSTNPAAAGRTNPDCRNVLRDALFFIKPPFYLKRDSHRKRLAKEIFRGKKLTLETFTAQLAASGLFHSGRSKPGCPSCISAKH
jgi:hypothetical protein